MADVTSQVRRLNPVEAVSLVAVLGTGKVSGAAITAASGIVTITRGSRISFPKTGLREVDAIELAEDVSVPASNNDELYARQLPGGASYEIAAATSTPTGAVKLADLTGTPVDTVVDTSPAEIGAASANEVAVEDTAGNFIGDDIEAALAELAISGGGVGFYALLRDEKATGVDAGTFANGAWRTRDLNIKVVDEIGITLASNQFTLPAGTYRIVATAPARAVDDHQIRLRNITDAATVIVGTSDRASRGNTDDNITRSKVVGQFTIVASKVFELQGQGTFTQIVDGFGDSVNFDEIEVYAIVELLKVA